MSEQQSEFEGWAILELMGHRRLAGFVRLGALIRIDIPNTEGEGNRATQFYGLAAMYCLTPTTEEIARKVAKLSEPQPVSPWELQERPRLPESEPYFHEDDGSHNG